MLTRRSSRSRHRRLRVSDIVLRAGAALVLVAGVVVCLWIALRSPTESVSAESAEAGQCVDLMQDAGGLRLQSASCTAAHDAEIVHTSDVGEAIAEQADFGDPQGVCTGLMADSELAAVGAYPGDLEWGLLIDDPANLDSYDRLVCYVSALTGTLDAPLIG